MSSQSPSPSTPSFAPASVLDIVTWGYKSAIRALVPMSQLVLPVVLLYSVISGAYYLLAYNLEEQAFGWVEIILLLALALPMLGCAIGLLYLNYALLRLIRDMVHQQAAENVYAYLIPDKTLLGCLGLCAIWLIASFPAMLIGMIGLLVLIIPGLVFLTYFYTWFMAVFAIYLDEPELGVGTALSRCWDLLGRSFLRTVGLGVLTWLIYSILLGILVVPQLFLEILQVLSPSVGQSLWFAVAFTILTALGIWFSMTIGYGGMVFVMFRYYHDLRLREAETLPPSPPEPPQEPPAPQNPSPFIE